MIYGAVDGLSAWRGARAAPTPVLLQWADLAGVVRSMDPRRDRDRAVAQRLLGVDRIRDTVIRNSGS